MHVLICKSLNLVFNLPLNSKTQHLFQVMKKIVHYFRFYEIRDIKFKKKSKSIVLLLNQKFKKNIYTLATIRDHKYPSSPEHSNDLPNNDLIMISIKYIIFREKNCIVLNVLIFKRFKKFLLIHFMINYLFQRNTF